MEATVGSLTSDTAVPLLCVVLMAAFHCLYLFPHHLFNIPAQKQFCQHSHVTLITKGTDLHHTDSATAAQIKYLCVHRHARRHTVCTHRHAHRHAWCARRHMRCAHRHTHRHGVHTQTHAVCTQTHTDMWCTHTDTRNVHTQTCTIPLPFGLRARPQSLGWHGWLCTCIFSYDF